MISKSLIEMIKGRAREFKREPSAMFFVVLMPVIWMLILGLAFSGEKKEMFGVALLTSDIEKRENHNVYGFLKNDSGIKLKVGSAKEHDSWLKRGDISLILGLNIADGSITYKFDPNNPQSKRARQIVNDKIQKFSGRADAVIVSDEKIDIKGSRYIDFLIPGLLALSILTSSLFGTGMTIVVNRRENLLKRYLTTPMNAYDYIISHIIGRYIILAAEFATIMIFGMLVFGFRVEGSWFAYIVMSCLGAAVFTAIAIFFGAKTANSSSYNGMTNLITLPMMLLSGVWFSRSGFPDWLGEIINFLPLTSLVDALRKIALEGQGLSNLIPEISVLCVYLVVGTVAAKMRFKWF